MKIAFYVAKYGEFIDRVISYLDGGPFSHTELVFSDGKWFSSSPRDGGVRFKEIIPNPEHWRFVDVPIDEEAIRGWCEEQCGAGYDWTVVIRILVPWLPSCPGRWFCSQICLTAMQNKGMFSGVVAKNCFPNTLYRLVTN